MIIRSQDKKQIVNFDVCHLSITADHCIVATNGLVSHPLELLSGLIGRYSSEENAIKVLDMIQDAYARCESVRTLTAGTLFEIAREFQTEERVNEYKNIHRENFVFQMPQDSEV